MAHFVEGVHYLTVDDLILINRNLIEKGTPDEPIAVINRSGLESSQIRPSQVRYYEQTDDMFVLASYLIHSLIQNHPFANANKRTAMKAGSMFLLLNGFELSAPESQLLDIAVGLANKEFTVDDLTDWVSNWARPFDSRELCLRYTESKCEILHLGKAKNPA